MSVPWGATGPLCPVGWCNPPITPLSCRVLPKLFPKYIRAPTGLEAEPVKQLLPGRSQHVPHKKTSTGCHLSGDREDMSPSVSLPKKSALGAHRWH